MSTLGTYERAIHARNRKSVRTASDHGPSAAGCDKYSRSALANYSYTRTILVVEASHVSVPFNHGKAQAPTCCACSLPLRMHKHSSASSISLHSSWQSGIRTFPTSQSALVHHKLTTEHPLAEMVRLFDLGSGRRGSWCRGLCRHFSRWLGARWIE